MNLEKVLKSVHSLAELEGVELSRQWVPWLPDWTDDEKAMILARKYELQRNNGASQKK